MQDRFKFRVWDSLENKMHEVVKINIKENYLSIEEDKISYIFDLNYDRAKLIQSTGLSDKNGNLIFEGDIVKVCGTEELGITEIDIEENCIVKWDKKSAFYFCDVINKRGIKLTEHGYYDFDYLPLFQNESDEEMFDFEIIGNIYANPELLNGF